MDGVAMKFGFDHFGHKVDSPQREYGVDCFLAML
jgi:hypothetical protein